MIVNPPDRGPESDAPRLYVIDKGSESAIDRGDLLNLYRERRLVRRTKTPMRIFLGTLTITESYDGAAVGTFTQHETAMEDPTLRVKLPMKGDFVIPILTLDSNVLFDPASAELKQGASKEFEKVADFMKFHEPSKLIIEGHTDSDGAEEFNQDLSMDRAQAVRQMLISEHDFITASMLEAKGYGEERPIASNDTDTGKSLNRHIEVLVWWEMVGEERVEATGDSLEIEEEATP